MWPVALTAVSTVLLLAAEARGSKLGVWIAKPLASTGFVLTAIAAGGLASSFGRWIVLALVLGWLGDVLLIPDARPAFLVGLASFLLGHLVFALAFVERGIAPGALVLAALALVLPAIATWRWLSGHVPPALRRPVQAYIATIVLMVACAVATAFRASAPLLLTGAFLFFFSDLSVARDRFVAPGFANKLWGLPLYYGGQLLLAASVAASA